MRVLVRAVRWIYWVNPLWVVTVAGLLALAGLVWIGLGAPWPGGRRW